MARMKLSVWVIWSRALIAFGLRAVLDEAEHPAMGVFRDWRKPPAAKARMRVQRRRRLAIGQQLALRVGLARRLGEFDVVDDVAAIARQLLIALLLDGRGARLGELPAMRPTFTTGEPAA